MPKGLRQVALSISRLSPIVRWPDALLATKMASLIFLPERGFFAFTSFHSLIWPSLSFGSSSLISRRRQSFALSRARFRPPGNIHNRSRLRLTRSTRPRFDATSFEDLAMRPGRYRISSDFNAELRHGAKALVGDSSRDSLRQLLANAAIAASRVSS